MNHSFIYSILLILLIPSAAYSQTEIEWKDTIIVSDIAVLPHDISDAESGKGRRARYGSEYGRMLHLKNDMWLAAYTVSRNYGYQEDENGGYQLEVAESSNNGKTWTKIGLISDPGRDLDNAQLIQLANGDILLACRSVRWQESYQLPVYSSDDNGHNWKKISVIDENEGKPGELGKPDKGVYEPHLEFLANGDLAVMYANEKHVVDEESYSQIISEKISKDNGQSWGEEIWVVFKDGDSASRPGMPVWTRMKNDNYIVVYEICATHDCNIYYKTSADGYHWPSGLGENIPNQVGGPFILSLEDGRLVVSSNIGNISISEDYSQKWHTTHRPWQHTQDYSENWHQTIWSSLYQAETDKIFILTSILRDAGGHAVKLRMGNVIDK